MPKHTKTMTSDDLSWLAGVIETSGTWYTSGGYLRFELKDETSSTVARVANLLSTTLSYGLIAGRSYFYTRLTGKRAIAFALEVLPYLTSERQVYILTKLKPFIKQS